MNVIYDGWTIDKTFPSGYWSAWKVGELPLMADTLRGLKDMIRHPEEIEAARRRVYG